MSCASVVVIVVVALPHSLFLSRSLNELSEYLHKIKCCPTSSRGRRGEAEREEAAQLSWQTCLKVAARLSRRRGTQKERESREEAGREKKARKREGGDCTRSHTKEMEKQRTTKHKYETRNSSKRRSR